MSKPAPKPSRPVEPKVDHSTAIGDRQRAAQAARGTAPDDRFVEAHKEWNSKLQQRSNTYLRFERLLQDIFDKIGCPSSNEDEALKLCKRILYETVEWRRRISEQLAVVQNVIDRTTQRRDLSFVSEALGKYQYAMTNRDPAYRDLRDPLDQLPATETINQMKTVIQQAIAEIMVLDVHVSCANLRRLVIEYHQRRIAVGM